MPAREIHNTKKIDQFKVRHPSYLNLNYAKQILALKIEWRMRRPKKIFIIKFYWTFEFSPSFFRIIKSGEMPEINRFTKKHTYL